MAYFFIYSSLVNGRYNNITSIGQGGQGVALKAFDTIEKKYINLNRIFF